MTTIPKPTTQLLAVGELRVINDKAQRGRVNRAHVNDIKENFDPRKLGAIIVSPRNGEGYHVLDGNHRVTAVREKFGEAVKVFCIVQSDLTSAEESDLFAGLNDSVKVLTRDRWAADLNAGETTTVEIEKILNRHGLRTGGSTHDGVVSAVTSCRKLYTGTKRSPGGPEILDCAIQTVVDAWGTKSASLNGDIMLGVGQFIGRHRDVIDRARLTRILAAYPGGPMGLLGSARGLRLVRRGGVVGDFVSEAVADAYNVGLRHKLAAWRA